MKAVCPACEKVFELSKVFFTEEADVKEDECSYYLIPEHPPTAGKKESSINSSKTGEVIKRICAGSYRPQRIIIQ